MVAHPHRCEWLQQLPAVVFALIVAWVVLPLSACAPKAPNVPTTVDASADTHDSAPVLIAPPVIVATPMPQMDNLQPPATVPDATDTPTLPTEPAIATPAKVAAKEPHPRAGQHKQVLIQQVRHVWGLKAPVSSFAAQIHQESRWNPTARSPVGAAGLTQFMPATAAWIGTYDRELAVVDVYNPRWAMRALAVYDKFLYDKVVGKNPCERMAFALSAYNGGLGWVNKRKARSPAPEVCFGATCEINPGISPANQRENANYPKLILKQYEPLYVRSGWGAGVCHE